MIFDGMKIFLQIQKIVEMFSMKRTNVCKTMDNLYGI